MKLKWARAATKHRISRERSRYVIEHCGLRFEQEAPTDAPAGASTRLVFLGDDAEGIDLESWRSSSRTRACLVIHAMPLRDRYRKQYEEAKNGKGEEDDR